jgi:tRNA (mo5U34)-methyltransferase
VNAAQATAPDGRSIQEAIVANPVWYHTLELAPGAVTPGWFDLRPIVAGMPWPDVAGKRCLDVGTYDGFLAFELERRGAAEVVCTDLSRHEDWDWPVDMRALGGRRLAELVSTRKGEGFRIAKAIAGSNAERVELSVYDLSPERIGDFDVVVCGSLMLHLRDPQRALEAIRSVCRGVFLSAEEIRLSLSIGHPRRALAELDGVGELCQWWVPNAAGHRRMVRAGGFVIERATRPYCVPFGAAHPPRRGWASRRAQLVNRLAAGGDGVPHSALLARPTG